MTDPWGNNSRKHPDSQEKISVFPSEPVIKCSLLLDKNPVLQYNNYLFVLIYVTLDFWPRLFKRCMDSAIHRINHFPADNTKDFVNTYPLDSDLSSG